MFQGLQNMIGAVSASGGDVDEALAALGITKLWDLDDDLSAVTARGHTVMGRVTKSAGGPLTIVGQSNSDALICADPGADMFHLLFEIEDVDSTYQPMVEFSTTSNNSRLYLGSSAPSSNLQYGNAAGSMTGAPVPRVFGQMIAAGFDLRTTNAAVNVWALGSTSYGGMSTVKYAGGAATRRLVFSGAFPGQGDGTLKINAAYIFR